MDSPTLLTDCEHCSSNFVKTWILPCGHFTCSECLLRDENDLESCGCPLCPGEPMYSCSSLTRNYPGTKQLVKSACRKCQDLSEIFAFCEGCGFICKKCFTVHIETHHSAGRCNFSTARRREVTAAKNELIICSVHQETANFFCLDCGILVCEKCVEINVGSHNQHVSIYLTKDLTQCMMQYFRNMFHILQIRREELCKGIPKFESLSQELDNQVQAVMTEIENRRRDMVQMIENQAWRLGEQVKSFETKQKQRINIMLSKIASDVSRLDRFHQWNLWYRENIVNEFQQLHMNINMESSMYDLSRRYIADKDLDAPVLEFEIMPNMSAVIMNTLGIIHEKPVQWPIRSLDEFKNYPHLPRVTRLLQEFFPGNQAENLELNVAHNGAIGEGQELDFTKVVSEIVENAQHPASASMMALEEYLDNLTMDFGENQLCTNIRPRSPTDHHNLETDLSLSKWPLDSRQQSSCESSGSPDLEVSQPTGMELALCNLNVELNLTDSIINRQVFQPVQPLNYLVQREQMRYYGKFGEFGQQGGQFSEPSGLAVLLDGQIVVADTNSHRIQVFKNGQFHFQFGTEGRREGQFMYPNRVAVCPVTGTIVITERSPTHQIQIYTPQGDFVRKFGNQVLQHPRGVCVDKDGRIIVVECKVMQVVIFDPFGHVINRFKCERLQFPNSIAVDDQYRIYICDNKAHSALVFNYEGSLLGTIGNPGLTNYPIGVAVYKNGHILVADNHNNFNVTIFTPQGVRVRALESMVKHAQCLDIAMLKDGSMALACKDYRIYIYQFIAVNGTTDYF